jgi:O-acetylserine/cysteine efflux transporter
MLSPTHLLLALLATAIWGLNYVVIKLGVGEVPPLLLTGLRFFFAALPAVFFVRRPTSRFSYVVSYGVVLGVIQFGLLFVSMKLGLSASLASLVLQLQAFFTIGLAASTLGDVPKPVQLAGAALAFAGIGIIAINRWHGPELVPLLICVLAAFAWGVANIIVKKSNEKDMLAFIVWASLMAPLPLFALSWLLEDHAEIIRTLTHPSLLAMGAIAYLAWPVTILGFALWNFLLSKYPVSSVAPFSLLIPVFGVLSGVLLLNDSLGAATMAGAALVFAGLALNVFGPRLRKN